MDTQKVIILMYCKKLFILTLSRQQKSKTFFNLHLVPLKSEKALRKRLHVAICY
jgi:hypothetical protein